MSGDDAVRVVLFDLGGVIMELAGLDRFLAIHQIEVEDFWPRWLKSEGGHRFESGQIDADEFVAIMIRDFELTATEAEVLDQFTAWPSGIIDGALDLVHDVSSLGLTTATLSNTNSIHWNSDLGSSLQPRFDRHFPSFELGLAKPDPAIFHTVVDRLGIDAHRVAFVDDNQLNVEAARRVGIRAVHGRGPIEARRELADLPGLRGLASRARR